MIKLLSISAMFATIVACGLSGHNMDKKATDDMTSLNEPGDPEEYSKDYPHCTVQLFSSASWSKVVTALDDALKNSRAESLAQLVAQAKQMDLASSERLDASEEVDRLIRFRNRKLDDYLDAVKAADSEAKGNAVVGLSQYMKCYFGNPKPFAEHSTLSLIGIVELLFEGSPKLQATLLGEGFGQEPQYAYESRHVIVGGAELKSFHDEVCKIRDKAGRQSELVKSKLSKFLSLIQEAMTADLQILLVVH